MESTHRGPCRAPRAGWWRQRQRHQSVLRVRVRVRVRDRLDAFIRSRTRTRTRTRVFIYLGKRAEIWVTSKSEVPPRSGMGGWTADTSDVHARRVHHNRRSRTLLWPGEGRGDFSGCLLKSRLVHQMPRPRHDHLRVVHDANPVISSEAEGRVEKSVREPSHRFLHSLAAIARSE